jgi:hypothetical protein
MVVELDDVDAGAPVAGGVAGERAGAVVVVVICPRRYFPSSVPPHPAAVTSPAAATAETRILPRSSMSAAAYAGGRVPPLG